MDYQNSLEISLPFAYPLSPSEQVFPYNLGHNWPAMEVPQTSSPHQGLLFLTYHQVLAQS